MTGTIDNVSGFTFSALMQDVVFQWNVSLGSWKATADYQFIANPGYNRDRGPVSVLSGRLRRQFLSGASPALVELPH